MLNDPQIVEAARFLALRMQTEAGNDTGDRLRYGFRLVTGRQPSPREQELLTEMYRSERAAYASSPSKVRELLSNGAKGSTTNDALDLACLANIALALMNTDEFLTRK